jgi:HK97 family phage prohead protease
MATNDTVAEPVRKQLLVDVAVLAERRVRFVVTTDTPDRERDVIVPAGIDLTNFLRNPVIPFAHDYRSLPVGRAVEVARSEHGIEMVIEFATADLNPMAEYVYRMVKAGFLRGASVGFRPLEWTFNEDRKGYDYIRCELLEVSVVPVPANAEALMAASFDEDRALLKAWAQRALDAIEADEEAVAKGVSPKDVSRSIDDDEEVPWAAPVLKDFTEASWEECSKGERRRIAGHYGWSAEMPPAAFGSLKLPHHSPASGKVIWRGLVSAAARLGRTQIPDEDRDAVKAHLARHYQKFRDAEDMPDSLKAAPWDRDTVGWAAYVKAGDRLERRLQRELTDGELAGLLEDYGLEAEAAVLREQPAPEPDPEPEPDEPPDDAALLREAIAALREAAATLAGLQKAAPSPEPQPAPESGSRAETTATADGPVADETVLWLDGDDDTLAVLLAEDGEDGDVAKDADRCPVDAELVVAAVKEALTDLVRAQTQAAINALRGRID